MIMNIMLLRKLENRNSRSHRENLERQLQVQRALNAELLRTCRQQTRLIDEQSLMITEILEEVGR